MAYPYTETGYNMFDMLSMLQKAIRRGEYEIAGFAAQQLKLSFRTTMWNRMLVISSEDCFGVITKELFRLREEDRKNPCDENIDRAVALLCHSDKSRDACYFACNFILVTRNPRKIFVSREDMKSLKARIEGSQLDSEDYWLQDSMFGPDTMEEVGDTDIEQFYYDGAALQKAILHLDMDMAGFHADKLRYDKRDFLWKVLVDFAEHSVGESIEDEIKALRDTDTCVNGKKKAGSKDEIFLSKAIVLLCYCADPKFGDVCSSDMVEMDAPTDWSIFTSKPVANCELPTKEIPGWVYDCHTLKGKEMGKTDWDMTRTEQLALFPLRLAYFDDASWIYTYEDDYQNHRISKRLMELIWEFAETHEANPVKLVEYAD